MSVYVNDHNMLMRNV